MGFYIRPDTSPQTWSHPDAINSSAPAYLVWKMCEKWHLAECRSDCSDIYIYSSVFEKANETLPWALEEYLKWGKENCFGYSNWSEPAMSWGKLIDQEMFDCARDFIKKCAANHWGAECG